MSRNIMLTVAYQGTRYCGWQVQPNAPTIQEFVETAVKKLTGTDTRVLSASRTDSGVHALAQVASFETQSKIPVERMRRALQRYLPDDITIVDAREVSSEFHATYSAIRKRYRYLIFDGAALPPFLRHQAFRHRSELNVDAMKQALPALLGTHDFRCFETNYPNKATSVRTIMEATLERVPHWSMWAADHSWVPVDARPHQSPLSPLICFEIMADGFLYNMVRAIVGTLVQIGTANKPPEHMAEVVASMDRAKAGTTAPGHGLFLVQVFYPPEQLIPDAQPSGSAAPDDASEK